MSFTFSRPVFCASLLTKQRGQCLDNRPFAKLCGSFRDTTRQHLYRRRPVPWPELAHNSLYSVQNETEPCPNNAQREGEAPREVCNGAHPRALE